MAERPETRAQIEAVLQDAAEVTARTAEQAVDEVAAAAEVIFDALSGGQKLLIAGNGGSASEAQHVAAELVGRFRIDRRALPAIALGSEHATITAIANDLGYERVFARQIEALGEDGDILLAISTSGSSPNVLRAAEAAKALGIRVIALTGSDGGELAKRADLAILSPSDDTPRIQESHAAVVHAICEWIEAALTTSPAAIRPARALAPASLKELIERRRGWRTAGRTVVWTNGGFDILHVGHLRFLRQARALGDVLIVGVNSDASVQQTKGPGRPIIPAEERAELLGALRCVTAVTIFEEPTPIEAITALEPDIHCKGGDYPATEALPETETVRSYGGRVEILDLTSDRSTTRLIDLIDRIAEE